MFCLPNTFAPQITRNNNGNKRQTATKTNERTKRNKPLTFSPFPFLFCIASRLIARTYVFVFLFVAWNS